MVFRQFAFIALVAITACAADTAVPAGCPALDTDVVGAGLGLDGPALVVTAQDDYFDPPCLEVTQGGEVTIVVRNEGRHPHDVTLPGGNNVRVDSGQTAFLDARIDGTGLAYFCSIHAGMDGELVLDGG